MDIPQENFVKSVKRLYLLMTKHIERELRIYGLARSQFQVLYFIHKAGKLTQKELQQTMQVEPATLTGIIDGLVKKSLLERVENQDDKRSNDIKLTLKGETLRKKIPSLHKIIEEKMLHNFTKKEIEVTVDAISKMIQNLEKEN